MEAISPQSVGREFVRQYYTLLNKAPLHLHRFYSGDSSFVHGGLDKEDKMLEPVHGQQEIHEKIMQLNFRDCKAKIRQVDAHATLASGVVVQVLGELSNNHQPMRRFMQTFVLAPQTPKKFYVYNDIFRYQDEVFNDLEDNSSGSNDNATTFEGVKKVENVEAVENEKNFANDGIATVSIIDGVQKEPHLNGGGSSGSAVSVNELSPRVPVEVSSISVNSEPEPLEEPTAPVVVQEKQQTATDVIEDEKPPEVHEPENTISSSEGVGGSNPVAPVVVDEKPSVVNEAPVTPAPASTAATVTSVTSEAIASNSSSSEKPTYANLFKKSGGPLVASGPISLPPAGFSKATTTSAASSQPSAGSSLSGSSVTTAATAATSAGSGNANTSIATSGGSVGGSVKEGSPAAATIPAASAGFHGGKQPFRGQGTRGGGRGGLSSGNPSASRDRYHPSRESVSSNVGEDGERGDPRGSAPGGGQIGGDRGRGGGSRIGMNALANYPDSHQVFVGNLPHYCQEHNLEDLFSKFGKVVDVRINTKGVAQSKNLPDSQKAVPNFGFVVFEDEEAASKCLAQKPINLPNGHRLNVETKKKNNRDEGKGGFGGSAGGANRGQGSGSNFDRGSQEQLGGLGRGGLNSNSRGNPRGGARGSGRGGFSGGRGGGSGPPPQGGGGGGGASIPGAGNNAQPRTTYTRRS